MFPFLHILRQVALHVWIFSQYNTPQAKDLCAPRDMNSSIAGAASVPGAPKMWVFKPEKDGSFHMNATYYIQTTGLHYIFLKLCAVGSRALVHDYSRLNYTWNTDLIFLNPYGYTPARVYGFMPFFGLNSGLLGVVFLLFGVSMLRHREQLIRLHWGMLICIAVAILESALLYNTWMQVNEFGSALCYPSCQPGFLSAIVIGELKNTMARVFLLVVCMGLGVTKERLLKGVWFLILAVAAASFGFGVNLEIQSVSIIASGVELDPAVTLPSVMCDMFFLIWIFAAVQDTRKKLRAEKQTHKLSMYDKLARILIIVLAFWAGAVVLQTMKQFGLISWPWAYEWVWPCQEYVGYFVAVCLIAWSWGPSKVSSRLALSQQVATIDEDFGEIEIPDMERGDLEHNQNQFTIGDEDDEDDFGADDTDGSGEESTEGGGEAKYTAKFSNKVKRHPEPVDAMESI